MTILAVDLSSNNPVFNFPLAVTQGCTTTYLKLGGDNIPRYVSGVYAGRVDQARAAGMRVGHYWVTGGHDPEAAAAFYVRNLRNVQPSDFFVLDNEKLDDGNMYSDDEAARWIRTVQAAVGGSPRRVFMYCSESPLAGSPWTAVRATGAQALVAWYGHAPMAFGAIGSWPASQIGGHQYTDNGTLGGATGLDLNAFADTAFDYSSTASLGATLLGDDMSAQAESQIQAIYDAVFNGGPSMPDSKRSLGQSVKIIGDALDLVRRTVTQPVVRNGASVPQIQDNANTGTAVLELLARVGALQEAVAALSAGQGADPAKIQAAAEAGAAAALANLKLEAVTN